MQMDNLTFEYFDAFKHNCLKACAYNYLKLQKVISPMLYIDSAIRLYQLDEGKHFRLYNDPSNNILFPQYRYKTDHMWGRYGEVWERNMKYLDKGTPIIVDVDVFYLPYRTEYNKRHGSHGILLLQYDNCSVEIVDWSQPYFYHAWLDVEFLCNSRKSENPYSNNPFSGMSILCYSVAIESGMPCTTEEKAFRNWILNTKLSCEVFDNVSFLLETNRSPSFVKGISDSLYFIIPQLQFAILFHSSLNRDKNKALFVALNKALSCMRILNSYLIKLYLSNDVRNRDVVLKFLEECKSAFLLLKQLIKGLRSDLY